MDVSIPLSIAWNVAAIAYSLGLGFGLQPRKEDETGNPKAALCVGCLSIIVVDVYTVIIADLDWKFRIAISASVGAIAAVTLAEGLRSIMLPGNPPSRPQTTTDREHKPDTVPTTPSSIIGSGTTVVSIGQTGGVTTGTYINQAVHPEFRVIDERDSVNPDGSFSTLIVARIVAPITPGTCTSQFEQPS